MSCLIGAYETNEENGKREQSMKKIVNSEQIIPFLERDYPEYYSGVYYSSSSGPIIMLVHGSPDFVVSIVEGNNYLIEFVEYSLVTLNKVLSKLQVLDNKAILSMSVVQKQNSIVIRVNGNEQEIKEAIKQVTDFENIKIILEPQLINGFN